MGIQLEDQALWAAFRIWTKTHKGAWKFQKCNYFSKQGTDALQRIWPIVSMFVLARQFWFANMFWRPRKCQFQSHAAFQTKILFIFVMTPLPLHVDISSDRLVLSLGCWQEDLAFQKHLQKLLVYYRFFESRVSFKRYDM